MKVQEGYHNFMVKIQMKDGCFENRYVKDWAYPDSELHTMRREMHKRFVKMYDTDNIEVIHIGEVEYKYDDWETSI